MQVLFCTAIRNQVAAVHKGNKLCASSSLMQFLFCTAIRKQVAAVQQRVRTQLYYFFLGGDCPDL